MADDINEVSRLLGRIEASTIEAERQRTALFKKMDEFARLQSETNGVAKEALARVAKMEPHVEEFKNMRQRGLGIIMFIGGCGAVGGATIMQAFKAWWGH